MFNNDKAIYTPVIPEKLQALSGIQKGFLGLAVFASALLLMPNAALAQNECGVQVGTTPVECGDPSYGSGVTYDAVGDLFIEFTNPSVSNIGGAGVTLTGDGSESINFDSATTATELDSAGATAALLGVTTVDGNIVIATEDMDADFAPTTHGIYAESTGSGSIDINATGNVDANSGTNPSTSIGIEAVTGSGSLTITASDSVQGNAAGIAATSGSGSLAITTSGSVRGSVTGIDATSGSGDLTITASGVVNGGDVAIDATTGTGLLTINIDATGATDTIGGASDLGIRTNTAGTAVINIAAGRRVSSGIQALGNTLTLNNNGELNGPLDVSSLTGGYTFNNNAGALWEPRDSVTLSPGVVNNAGTIQIRRGDILSAPGLTYNGDGGAIQLHNAILDGSGQSSCDTPTLAGCLDLSGATTSGQTGIQVVTNPEGTTPFLVGLDKPISPGIVVIDLSGATTQADHFVLSPDSFARFDRDPGFSSDIIQIPIYAEDPVYGGVIETGGLFDYALLYNPGTQQQILASVPNREGVEYVSLIHESLSVWHTTSDAIAGRQADLRDGGQRGGWLRAFTGQTERDFTPVLSTHGNTFNYDRGYDLDTRGLVAGYDLTADDSHVFGVHLGFMATRLEHDSSPTVDETTFPSSVTFGTYAGWWSESGLTLDGTINVNLLDIEHDVRSGLEDTKTNVITAGIRGEAGWRFPMAESFYVQPHVIAAYAYADVERLDMRDYDAKFEDEESQRAALGVRLGGEQKLSGDRYSRVKYWLTARTWEEYAEDGNVQFVVEGGDPLIIEDDISDTFEEVGLGVSLTSPDEDLEVFLSGNVVSGDQVDSSNVTIGAKLRW